MEITSDTHKRKLFSEELKTGSTKFTKGKFLIFYTSKLKACLEAKCLEWDDFKRGKHYSIKLVDEDTCKYVLSQIELAKEEPQSYSLETSKEDSFDYFKDLPISNTTKPKKTEISKVNNPDGNNSFTLKVNAASCLNENKFKNNLNSTSFGNSLSPPLQAPNTFEITPNIVLNSLKHKKKVLSGFKEEEDKNEDTTKIKIDLDTYEVTKQEESPEFLDDKFQEVDAPK